MCLLGHVNLVHLPSFWQKSDSTWNLNLRRLYYVFKYLFCHLFSSVMGDLKHRKDVYGAKIFTVTLKRNFCLCLLIFGSLSLCLLPHSPYYCMVYVSRLWWYAGGTIWPAWWEWEGCWYLPSMNEWTKSNYNFSGLKKIWSWLNCCNFKQPI